jgi:hypothetical protein
MAFMVWLHGDGDGDGDGNGGQRLGLGEQLIFLGSSKTL